MVGRRDDKGLTSRCVDELFRLTADRRFEIGSSYLEIYNEKVENDLCACWNRLVNLCSDSRSSQSHDQCSTDFSESLEKSATGTCEAF